MPNTDTVRYTADEEFPDLLQHNNILARCLTLEIYKKLRSVQTPSGFTIDDVIQTGVDNPGNREIVFSDVGCICETFVILCWKWAEK